MGINPTTRHACITRTWPDGDVQSWEQEVDANLIQRWRRHGVSFTTNPDGSVSRPHPDGHHTETITFLEPRR